MNIGDTYRVTLTDGRELVAEPTLGDVVRLETTYKTSIERLTADGEPMWLTFAILRLHLKRRGIDLPDDDADFADLVAKIEPVTEGKAEGSDPTPSTG